MKRALTLPILLGALMASVFLLPKVGKIAESAVQMELPGSIGYWKFLPIQPSENETRILASDTEFSKAICYDPIPYSYRENGDPIAKRIDLSVVLSGNDINNSIHSPERCMPSQGHQIYDRRSDVLTTAAGRTFAVRKLTSLQVVPLDPEGKKVEKHHCLTLYFYVGQRQLTESALNRTLIDMRDRLMRGQDQRWAYITVTALFSDEGENGQRPLAVVEKEMRRFLGDFADRNINWAEITQTPGSL